MGNYIYILHIYIYIYIYILECLLTFLQRGDLRFRMYSNKGVVYIVISRDFILSFFMLQTLHITYCNFIVFIFSFYFCILQIKFLISTKYIN